MWIKRGLGVCVENWIILIGPDKCEMFIISKKISCNINYVCVNLDHINNNSKNIFEEENISR